MLVTASLKKELEAVNRRIKATIAMLADPSFEGLDEIKNTLSDLKSRRDGLQKKTETAKTPPIATLRESDRRDWAMEQITAIDRLIKHPTATIEARKLVHAIVHRIEIDPYAKQGTLYLPKDAFEVFKNSFCSWGSKEEGQLPPKFEPVKTDNTYAFVPSG